MLLLHLHLTDVLNSGMTFPAGDRTTLMRWGGSPQAVRAGSAAVALRSAVPGLKLFACDHAGNRVAAVEVVYAEGPTPSRRPSPRRARSWSTNWRL